MSVAKKKFWNNKKWGRGNSLHHRKQEQRISECH